MLGISKQAYYKRLKTDQSNLLVELQIKDMVLHVRHSFPRMGGRKLFFLLRDEMKQKGIDIGRDRFFDILRKHRLLVPKKKRHYITTNSRHRFYKYPNRIKDLVVSRPEQLWVSDITYIPTAKGYCYLHLVTDAYSRKIMGHHLSDNLKTESTLAALKMAVRSRIYPNQKLIHHSDRGLQYCNDLYTTFLDKHHITISMTQNSDPYENAIAERVNGILKDEFGLDKGFKSLSQAICETNRAICLYNNKRPHMSCNMAFPEIMHHQAN